MAAYKVLQIAERHLNNGAAMASSAEICYRDAEALYNKGKPQLAAVRAMRSLAYSVGMFHPDYVAADNELPRYQDTQGHID